MKIIFVYIVLFISLVSCQSATAEEAVEEAVLELEQSVEAVVEEPAVEIVGLPLGRVKVLLETCNMIEATFYQTSQSMSTVGETLAPFLAMIDFGNAPTTLNKEVQGHLLFLDDGMEIYFANLSLGSAGRDSYIHFEVDDKNYYNLLTPQGVEFFRGVALSK